ncbi:hypothetical protein D7X33_33675 [Butyricicoccus sp. 1XD8-22]|nr:hypothetical protein D7X33_33675 [Butyricicoccus sp. 1XD8-22]
MMMQIAVYMGIEEIYLLGVDFSYNISNKDVINKAGVILEYNGEQTHFHSNYRKPGELYYSPAVDKQIGAYQFAKNILIEKNITIFNCTRVTKLEVFETKRLEEVLNYKN